MDAVLPLATLLALWPSLLPRWRAMLVATLLTQYRVRLR